jgi:hypothetical protein
VLVFVVPGLRQISKLSFAARPSAAHFVTCSPTTWFALIVNIIKEWSTRRSSPNSLQVQGM